MRYHYFWVFLLISLPVYEALNLGKLFGKQQGDTEEVDLLVTLIGNAGFEARISAGHPSRMGLKTAIVTSKLPDSKRQDLGMHPSAETWLQYQGDKLQDMAPFVAHKELGGFFKWMFVGEDDTLFFPEAARKVIAKLDHNQPHFITDEAWFVSAEGKRHVSKAEAAQCVPCPYEKDMKLLPDHFHKACDFCNVSGPILPGFCGPESMPSMSYAPHGGPGYLLSLGIFRHVSYNQMKRCLRGDKDIYLARCLWKAGIGATDPDPLWHPDGLTHFDSTPPPYLTHESIMEKTSFALGKLLRSKAGLCNDLCKTEMEHMISLHINGARMGFTQNGDVRVGIFKDAGSREYAGQLVLSAISDFISHLNSTDPPRESLLDTGLPLHRHKRIAAQHMTDAVSQITNLKSFFQDSVSYEQVSFNVSTLESSRSRVAAMIAKEALSKIQEEALN